MSKFDLNRRGFLKSMGAAGLALTPGLDKTPIKKIFPKLIPAEEIIPGTPYWFASTCRECPAGCGVLLKVREENVIKIEGNPNHPVSHGGLCPRGQAALQELYHPDRLRKPVTIVKDQPRKELSWEEAINEIKPKTGKGGKVVFLSGTLSGSQKQFVETWLKAVSVNAEHVSYEIDANESLKKANELLFNKSALPEYHLENADLVISFGADFMETWHSPVKLSQQFSQARRFHDAKSAKFVYIGCADTLTSANADLEYKILPGTETVVLLALANYVLENKTDSELAVSEKTTWLQSLDGFTLQKAAEVSGLREDILTKIGNEIISQSNGVVLCGDSLAAHERGTDSYLAAFVLNYAAGYFGKTISVESENNDLATGSVQNMAQLIQQMEAGKVGTLFIYNTNPLFTWPDSGRLQKALQKVPNKIALVVNQNETSAYCNYILPVHHTIETWGIEMPESGVYSLVQPAMEPVFKTQAMENILLALQPAADLTNSLEEYIEKQWQQILKNSTETTWEQVVVNGGLWPEQSAIAPVPRLNRNIYDTLRKISIPPKNAGLTLAVHLSQRYFDGRGANKAWLWEVPNSLHHYVWEIPVRINPELAKQEGLKEGDIVSISANNRQIEAPVLLTKDIPKDVIAMEIGAGHSNYGRYAVNETGNPLSLLPDKNDIQSGAAVLFAQNAILSKTEKWRKIVRLQGGYDQGERKIIQAIPFTEAVKMEKSGATRKPPHFPPIYPEHKHKNYDWTMVVDLSACNGCGACAVACYAENAVPVVGKKLCGQGREMAWIRIERFEVNGRPQFIPIMCQQCEAAPCETVCPVYATAHSEEGLNMQVYNRCVGTRYCSNNCPYKARRFNFFPAQWPKPMNRQLNPDIYHRPKGVMEKCTFCLARIRRAKEDAKIEGRKVRDGEFTTACAQSCPTNAITFGNLNDPESKVSKLLNDFRGYIVFENLNTQPSVIYLKGIQHV